jgi:hypothetical protein
MTSSGDNRSINVGSSVKNSSLLTGDHATVTHVTLPPPSTVDPKAQLAALRDLLAGLNVPERRRLDNALQEADDELAKPDPDKDEVAGAVGRVLKAAKGANTFAEQLEKLAPRVAAIASWAGPAGRALLSLVGLSA